MSATKEDVKNYYGNVLESSKDLKTSACCPSGAMAPHHSEILAQIEPEIRDKFYGCGSPIPPLLDNRVVLDLGCGTGRDVYLASRLVGPGGHVIGVDMTENQLAVARRHLDKQMTTFGYDKPNVEFHQGYIEDLQSLGIADHSVDIVMSNCVLNLSTDKSKVFAEIFRVLKPGGELYFSDVFTSCRVPEALKRDPVLYGECLAGALYPADFRALLHDLGIRDYRVMSRSPIALTQDDIKAKVGMIGFYSLTVRAFQLACLEASQEDYGQTATYLGTVPHAPDDFTLDEHQTFATGTPLPVSGNTAAILTETRYGDHFQVQGSRTRHYGPFHSIR